MTSGPTGRADRHIRLKYRGLSTAWPPSINPVATCQPGLMLELVKFETLAFAVLAAIVARYFNLHIDA